MSDKTKLNTPSGDKKEDKEPTMAELLQTITDLSNKVTALESKKEETPPVQKTTVTPPSNARIIQENVALKKVLASHNIAFDLEKADLSKIVVNDKGEHAGDFEYTAPALSNKSPNAWNATPGKEITMDDVKKMTAEQINANWDKVEPILASSAN